MITMKNGQCRSCGSYHVRSNRNRKFPALNTITLGSGNSSARYASLDTYVCVSCGYVENYVASHEDLNYISQEWEKVEVKSESPTRSQQNTEPLHPKPDDEFKTEALQAWGN